jgi:hypothetical protein
VAETSEYRPHLRPIVTLEDAGKLAQGFHIPWIKATRCIYGDVIETAIPVFICGKIVRVHVPLHQRAIHGFANDSFRMCSLHTVADKCTPYLFGE